MEPDGYQFSQKQFCRQNHLFDIHNFTFGAAFGIELFAYSRGFY